MAEYGRYGIEAAPDETDPVRRAFNQTLGRYPSPAPGQPDSWKTMQQAESAEGRGLVDPVPGAVELAAKYTTGVGPAWLRAIGAVNEPRPAGETFRGAPYSEGVVPGPIKALRREQIGETLGIKPPKSVPVSDWNQQVDQQIPRRQFRQSVQKAVSDISPLTSEEVAQQSRINDRNLVYHATDVHGLEGIMKARQIRPSTYPGTLEDLSGVSVSRVPRVASKSDKPVTLAIDASRMPPTRPYAEVGYRKTGLPPDAGMKMYHDFLSPEENNRLADIQKLTSEAYGSGGTPGQIMDKVNALEEESKALVHKGYNAMAEWQKNNPVPNRRFEFENRTYGKPIPASAIKRILVDNEALYPPGSSNKAMYQWDKDAIEDTARYHKLPVEYYPSGRSLHASPAAGPTRIPRALPTTQPAPASAGLPPWLKNLADKHELDLDDLSTEELLKLKP